ncbi:ThiF family adenylyltransferase [Saccharibacillus alkalitolerans]|uniref:Thiazole biosynthesis adenylyltransferase ThiF n=1 Tax=Saccharibacillus alkalitolerans TaxID=2705290 RepID=A0ABX0FDQ8_9BACL|nr:ThiF family adenylyltransferase [Saccharibacillus alkalitolerans]NGZ76512.1 thiazole biosynthesis adenylyltransferase ThiF [Saccharibacillus alkalitolerans]
MRDCEENRSSEERERYSRQMLFAPIGENGQRRLAERSVCIVGMGALGTVLANHMVRAGVGTVRMADRDYVESSNLQRQMLYDEEDAALALPKVEAAKRKLQKINSSVRLETSFADVAPGNIEDLLKGVDLVLDGTDNFQTRFLLNDACYSLGIPFVYGGAVGSRGMSAVFVPGETPCLRCFIPSADSGGETCDTVGVISPIVDIVASYQAAEALKLLVGDDASRRKTLLSLDVWHNRHHELKPVAPRPDCPCCGLKHYPALRREEETALSLCGRESVQIAGHAPFDLEVWRQRLEPAARSLKANPYLIRAEMPGGERLVLFEDGRVLVQGTDDPARARTIYARYIGN